MSREKAEKLLRLATSGQARDGGEEERRTAAVQAARLIVEGNLLGGPSLLEGERRRLAELEVAGAMFLTALDVRDRKIAALQREIAELRCHYPHEPVASDAEAVPFQAFFEAATAPRAPRTQSWNAEPTRSGRYASPGSKEWTENALDQILRKARR